MKAFLFSPSNDFLGKFDIAGEEQLQDALSQFLRSTKPIPDGCYIEAFHKTWTIVSYAPLRLVEGRIAVEKMSLPPIPTATTPILHGHEIVESLGVVTGEAIMGANLFRDIAANMRDIVGGRSGAYESKVREGRSIALEEMIGEARQRGATAVVGVTIGYETVGASGSMLMICASGTAVTVRSKLQSSTPEVINGPGMSVADEREVPVHGMTHL